MKKFIKSLEGWTTKNRKPFLITMIVLLILAGTIALLLPDLPLLYCSISVPAMTGVFFSIFNSWKRGIKLISLILASIFLLNPVIDIKAQQTPRPQPKVALECIAAVTVIVVGSVVIYKFVWFCKKHFGNNPSPTNNPPIIVTGNDMLIGGKTKSLNLYDPTNYYAAVIPFGGVPSYQEPSTNSFVFDVICMVQNTNGLSISISPYNYFNDSITNTNDTEANYWQSLVPWGISGNNETTAYFGKNGHPCAAADVPVTITNGVVTVNPNDGRPLYTSVIQMSRDLTHWTSVFTNIQPANMPFIYSVNNGSQSQFYKAAVFPPFVTDP